MSITFKFRCLLCFATLLIIKQPIHLIVFYCVPAEVLASLDASGAASHTTLKKIKQSKRRCKVPWSLHPSTMSHSQKKTAGGFFKKGDSSIPRHKMRIASSDEEENYTSADSNQLSGVHTSPKCGVIDNTVKTTNVSCVCVLMILCFCGQPFIHGTYITCFTTT